MTSLNVCLRNFAKLPEPAPLESVFNPVDVENGLHGNTGNRMAELASDILDLILLHLGFRPRVYASLVCKRFTVRVCAFYRSVRVTTDQNHHETIVKQSWSGIGPRLGLRVRLRLG